MTKTIEICIDRDNNRINLIEINKSFYQNNPDLFLDSNLIKLVVNANYYLSNNKKLPFDDVTTLFYEKYTISSEDNLFPVSLVYEDSDELEYSQFYIHVEYKFDKRIFSFNLDKLILVVKELYPQEEWLIKVQLETASFVCLYSKNSPLSIVINKDGKLYFAGINKDTWFDLENTKIETFREVLSKCKTLDSNI